MSHPWARRLVTIPLVALACALTWTTLPALLVLALVIDVCRFALARRAFMATRLTLFALYYLSAEVIGLAALTLVWVGTLPRGRGASIDATYKVQRHWARGLFGAARRLLSLEIEVDGDACVTPGPIVVLLNHASLLDALLPTVLVTHAHGIRLRFVLKRELLVSPCLDVAGLRLPNVFVDRSATQTQLELDKIRALGLALGPNEGALIYPEGTRMTADKRTRALAKLAESDPVLHAEASSLEHVLPPRFGGTFALLDGAPEADVVFLAHRGLEGFAHYRDFLAGRLVGSTIHVRMWRVPRREIPVERDARARWLLARWREVDAFVGSPRA
ncbi:MAG: 1-acyl-sn-glycerol-3-phosphate acyltransferase [Deltaproteobacteria bacterium]|nr:1-acyl-sn-glycerol-3-phosphate acyltransferase [Deltaproteobacteria bacterium]